MATTENSRRSLSKRIRASFDVKRSKGEDPVVMSPSMSPISPSNGKSFTPVKQDHVVVQDAVSAAINGDAFQSAIAAHLAKLVHPSIKSALDTIQPVVERVYQHDVTITRMNKNLEDILLSLHPATRGEEKDGQNGIVRAKDVAQTLAEHNRQNDGRLSEIQTLLDQLGRNLGSVLTDVKSHGDILVQLRDAGSNTEVLSAIKTSQDSHSKAIDEVKALHSSFTAATIPVFEKSHADTASAFGTLNQNIQTVSASNVNAFSDLTAKVDNVASAVETIKGNDANKEVLNAVQKSNDFHAAHASAISEIRERSLAPAPEILVPDHADKFAALDEQLGGLAKVANSHTSALQQIHQVVTGEITPSVKSLEALPAQLNGITDTLDSHRTLLNSIKDSTSNGKEILNAVHASNASHEAHSVALSQILQKDSSSPIITAINSSHSAQATELGEIKALHASHITDLSEVKGELKAAGEFHTSHINALKGIQTAQEDTATKTAAQLTGLDEIKKESVARHEELVAQITAVKSLGEDSKVAQEGAGAKLDDIRTTGAVRHEAIVKHISAAKSVAEENNRTVDTNDATDKEKAIKGEQPQISGIKNHIPEVGIGIAGLAAVAGGGLLFSASKGSHEHEGKDVTGNVATKEVEQVGEASDPIDTEKQTEAELAPEPVGPGTNPKSSVEPEAANTAVNPVQDAKLTSEPASSAEIIEPSVQAGPPGQVDEVIKADLKGENLAEKALPDFGQESHGDAEPSKLEQDLPVEQVSAIEAPSSAVGIDRASKTTEAESAIEVPEVNSETKSGVAEETEIVPKVDLNTNAEEPAVAIEPEVEPDRGSELPERATEVELPKGVEQHDQLGTDSDVTPDTKIATDVESSVVADEATATPEVKTDIETITESVPKSAAATQESIVTKEAPSEDEIPTDAGPLGAKSVIHPEVTEAPVDETTDAGQLPAEHEAPQTIEAPITSEEASSKQLVERGVVLPSLVDELVPEEEVKEKLVSEPVETLPKDENQLRSDPTTNSILSEPVTLEKPAEKELAEEIVTSEPLPEKIDPGVSQESDPKDQLPATENVAHKTIAVDKVDEVTDEATPEEVIPEVPKEAVPEELVPGGVGLGEGDSRDYATPVSVRPNLEDKLPDEPSTAEAPIGEPDNEELAKAQPPSDVHFVETAEDSGSTTGKVSKNELAVGIVAATAGGVAFRELHSGEPTTKPAATEPAATEPEATEPVTTEATESTAAEPAATEPVSAKAVATEPEATEPEAAKLETTEPVTTEATESAATEPVTTEPVTAKAVATEPETTKLETTKATESAATEPAATEPVSAKSVATEPEASKLETTEATESAAAEPAATEPVSAKAVATEPEATEPEAAKLETTEPVTTEATESAATEPATTESVTAKAVATEPEATKLESTEPVTTEATESTATEPTATEPVTAKAVAIEPEATEPEATKLETTEPVTTEATEAATEPAATEPVSSKAVDTEPEATEPEATKLETTEPVTTEATESAATEPAEVVATEPEATEPEATKLETTEPVTNEATELTATEPTATEPVTAKSVATEPEATELEATEPVTTKATEPAATEPVTAKLVATEPEATEPVTTEATKSTATEPAATEPAATETKDTESGATELVATEPAATEPVTAKSVATKPEATEPEVTEPETAEPVTAEATKSTATEPVATEKKDTEPEATESVATEPAATEPVTAKSVVIEPEATEPEATEPEATEPEATEPEATESVAAKSVATEPEATEPVTTGATESAATEPATTEPVTAKSVATKPVITEATESAATESAATESAATEKKDTDPEATESVATEPAATKSVTAKSVIIEPEATEPVTTEATEPAGTEPVTAKPATAESAATEATEATESVVAEEPAESAAEKSILNHTEVSAENPAGTSSAEKSDEVPDGLTDGTAISHSEVLPAEPAEEAPTEEALTKEAPSEEVEPKDIIAKDAHAEAAVKESPTEVSPKSLSTHETLVEDTVATPTKPNSEVIPVESAEEGSIGRLKDDGIHEPAKEPGEQTGAKDAVEEPLKPIAAVVAAANDKVTEEPAKEEPAAQPPVVEESAIQDTTFEDPVSGKPNLEEPTVDEPKDKESTTDDIEAPPKEVPEVEDKPLKADVVAEVLQAEKISVETPAVKEASEEHQESESTQLAKPGTSPTDPPQDATKKIPEITNATQEEIIAADPVKLGAEEENKQAVAAESESIQGIELSKGEPKPKEEPSRSEKIADADPETVRVAELEIEPSRKGDTGDAATVMKASTLAEPINEVEVVPGAGVPISESKTPKFEHSKKDSAVVIDTTTAELFPEKQLTEVAPELEGEVGRTTDPESAIIQEPEPTVTTGAESAKQEIAVPAVKAEVDTEDLAKEDLAETHIPVTKATPEKENGVVEDVGQSKELEAKGEIEPATKIESRNEFTKPELARSSTEDLVKRVRFAESHGDGTQKPPPATESIIDATITHSAATLTTNEALTAGGVKDDTPLEAPLAVETLASDAAESEKPAEIVRPNSPPNTVNGGLKDIQLEGLDIRKTAVDNIDVKKPIVQIGAVESDEVA